jgi:hypothetical protein
LEVCIPEFKGASVVAVKRVNELDFYSLGAKEFAEKLDRSVPKAVAMVDYLKIRLQPDCYKEFKIGSVLHKRYSSKALETIKEALQTESAQEIWNRRKTESSMVVIKTKW